MRKTDCRWLRAHRDDGPAHDDWARVAVRQYLAAERPSVISVARPHAPLPTFLPAHALHHAIVRRHSTTDIAGLVLNTEFDAFDILSAERWLGEIIAESTFRIEDLRSRPWPFGLNPPTLDVVTLNTLYSSSTWLDVLHFGPGVDAVGVLAASEAVLASNPLIIIDLSERSVEARADLLGSLGVMASRLGYVFHDEQGTHARAALEARALIGMRTARADPVRAASPMGLFVRTPRITPETHLRSALGVAAVGAFKPEMVDGRATLWCGPRRTTSLGLWLPRPGWFRLDLGAVVAGDLSTNADVTVCVDGEEARCRIEQRNGLIHLSADLYVDAADFNGFVAADLISPDSAFSYHDRRRLGLGLINVSVTSLDEPETTLP